MGFYTVDFWGGFAFDLLFIIIHCYPANDQGEEKQQEKLQCASHILDV